MKVIDLFAGAGGLSLGAERAGFNVALAVENDLNAIKTHKKNFSNTIHFENDIMGLDGNQIRNYIGNELCGIIGGPPCQGFSSIGNGDVNDPRNSLFEKFFSLVQEVQPIFYLAENVPGILNSKYKMIVKKARDLVKNDYINLRPITIKANEYGAPTTRTRVFFIGYKPEFFNGKLNANEFRKAKVDETERVLVKNALKGLPSNPSKKNVAKIQTSYFSEDSHPQYFHDRVKGVIPNGVGDADTINKYIEKRIITGMLPTEHSKDVMLRYKKLPLGKRDIVSKSVKLDPNSFCPTIRAGTGADKGSYQAVRPIHYSKPRVITPREAARMQGFPDWFVFSETIWHSFRQIGNSVSPIVAEKILQIIRQKLILWKCG